MSPAGNTAEDENINDWIDIVQLAASSMPRKDIANLLKQKGLIPVFKKNLNAVTPAGD